MCINNCNTTQLVPPQILMGKRRMPLPYSTPTTYVYVFTVMRLGNLVYSSETCLAVFAAMSPDTTPV